MRIAATSDLHGRLPEIPEADVLVICGDIGPATKKYHRDMDHARKWLQNEFSDWLLRAPVKHIIGIAGNHDFVLQKTDVASRLPWIYLEDSGKTVEGIKFWGSPWTPKFFGWAFMDSDRVLEDQWKLIPEDTDVLLTHGPALGCKDRNLAGFQCGSKTLLKYIPEDAWHFFGHIHEARGKSKKRNSYNVSHCDARYRGTGPVVTVDI